MNTWLIIFFALFFGLLFLAGFKSYSRNRSSDEFMLGGTGLGAFLGFLTYAAALFSAFTFMGMPDFFRNHGVGAWLFLALSDGFMVFFLLWFGYKLRMRAKDLGYKGISGMVIKSYDTPWAGYLLFLSSFVFLVPYVAIQIRGISIFLDAAFPELVPFWAWSIVLVVIMLLYAQIGGLKAIVFADAVQALILLVVIWLIGYTCVNLSGGLETMFSSLQPELKNLPGPKGLFTWQFLLVSAISITLIPVTQPQFTTRLVVMKDLKSLHKMAYAVGLFAIVVILPTAFIGFYGALKYPEVDTSKFLSSALLYDQSPIVAALAVVGLFAACLSTTNAQIFALGTEIRSLLSGSDKSVMLKTRIAMFLFTAAVLVFAFQMSNQLALLARVSFTGTGMIAPVVLGAIIFKKPPKVILLYSAIAWFVFLLSLGGVVPPTIFGWSLDLILFLSLAVLSSTVFLRHKK